MGAARWLPPSWPRHQPIRCTLMALALSVGDWHLTGPGSIVCLAAAEDSCPAHASDSPACAHRTETGLAPPGEGSRRIGGADTVAKAKAGLITQEIDELNRLVKRCKERIELLTELKTVTSSGYNLSLPDAHARLLNAKMPLMSDIEVDVTKAPTASSDDFFIPKAFIPQDTAVSLIKFLPLRSTRAQSAASNAQTAMPSALLVALQEDGAARLFTPAGDLVLAFTTGHEHPVVQLTVSPSQDEYLVVTADSMGFIRVHKISVRQRRPSKQKRQMSARLANQERSSQYLGLQVNVTAQLNKQISVFKHRNGSDVSKLTALLMASQQGTKYYIAGDSSGRITIFTKNGTLHATIQAGGNVSGTGVDQLYAHLGNLLFRAGSDWGLIDLEHMEPRRFKCPRFQGKVTAAVIDSAQAARVLVADEDGTIWVFNIKEKRECKVEHRFQPGATKAPVTLGSVRGFMLGLHQMNGVATLLALNMSHVGKKRYELSEVPSPVVWRRTLAPLRTWTVFKRYQQGDLLAFLSEDGREIEIAELLMTVYQAPQADSLSNFKLPVIAVAVLLVLGYQYMKKPGEGDLDPSSFEGKLGGKKKMGGKKGGIGGGAAKRSLKQ